MAMDLGEDCCSLSLTAGAAHERTAAAPLVTSGSSKRLPSSAAVSSSHLLDAFSSSSRRKWNDTDTGLFSTAALLLRLLLSCVVCLLPHRSLAHFPAILLTRQQVF